MIIDFNASDAPVSYSPSLCIIGAGAVGLAIASRFFKDKQHDILIIEAGGLQPTDQSGLSNVINTGDVSSCLDGSFNQCFGGSTVSWGGQALPFSQLDLSHRPWVPDSEWPIDYHTIDEYYRVAEGLLGVDYVNFNADIWSKYAPTLIQSIPQNGLQLGFSKWLPEPNFSRLFKPTIQQSESINTLVNATVTQIRTDANSTRVEQLALTNQQGKVAQVRPKITILAAGGIESIRILLHSPELYGSDAQPQLPQLGNYYQDHIGFYGARLFPRNWQKFRALFATKLHNGHKCLPKVSLTDDHQRKHSRLNVTGNLGVEYEGKSAIASTKAIYHAWKNPSERQFLLKHIKTAVENSPEVFASTYSYLLQKQLYIPKKQRYFLIANCESPPMQQSHIRLSEEKDHWGMNKAEIHWQLNDASRDAMRDYYQRIKHNLETNDIADVTIKDSLFQDDREWHKKVYSLYHHMGGTRMGHSRANSVVDANCKIHSVNDIYIAGCSLFPSSSSSNPTFTAIALALRLADHLKGILDC